MFIFFQWNCIQQSCTQTRSNWIVSLKSGISLIVSGKLIRWLFGWITQLLKSSICKSLSLLFSIFLTIIWFYFSFFVFITLSANFISVWPNICSNNFLSIIFDISASSILKFLNFNSLSPKSLSGQYPFKSSNFFNDFICSSNDFGLSIISSKRSFFFSFIISF